MFAKDVRGVGGGRDVTAAETGRVDRLIAEERLVAGRVEILRDEIDATGW